MFSAVPVCSCAFLFANIAHETAGAARIRSSLRPLISEGANEMQNFGQIMPRERERMSHSRHCERSEAIHASASCAIDCFAALAMTWIGRRATTAVLCSAQPIQIRLANRAAFMNSDALKSPITASSSHFARSPRWASTTNSGNETRLNRLMETKAAGPPLSVR